MSEIIEFVSGHFNSIENSLGSKFSKPRTVKYYEIELFSDSYFYTNINKKKYLYNKGTIIISKPNDIRNSKLHFECQYIHIALNDGELKDFFDSVPNSVILSEIEKYQQIFNSLANLFVKKATKYQILSQMYTLIELLHSDIISEKELAKKRTENLLLFQSSLQYIEKHYKEDLSINKLAENVHLHPNYYIKVFKHTYGKTPMKYLQEIRIAHAKYALLNTNKSIGEIGLACGFNSQTYFTSVFTKECKLSPINFRNKFKRPL